MLPYCMIYKILSYAEGNPQIYLNTALCCKEFRAIATSDHAWQRFNVFNVQKVYKHFLAERSEFKRVEKLFYSFIDISQVPQSIEISSLNPYTQLVILLKPALFAGFCNQVTNGRVMELGALEPGNLLFYACPELRASSELARLSLCSRQHPRIMMPPIEWNRDLQLDWHFAYANIDSEVHAPYTPDFDNLNVRGWLEIPRIWSPMILLDLSLLNKQNRNRVGYMLCAEGDYIKMGDQYFCIDDDEHFERTETDPAYCQAALDSGCPIFCFKNPSHETQIKALQRGGVREMVECELPFDEIIDHNSWGLYTGIFADKNSFKGLSFEKLVQVTSKNAYIEPDLGSTPEQHRQVDKAKKSAKQNGKWLRYEGRKHCQIEWFSLRALHRPLAGELNSAARDRFADLEFTEYHYDVYSSKDVDCTPIYYLPSSIWWTKLGRPFILFWPWQYEVHISVLEREYNHWDDAHHYAFKAFGELISEPRYHFIHGLRTVRNLDELVNAFPEPREAREFFLDERAQSIGYSFKFTQLLFTKPRDFGCEWFPTVGSQSYLFMFLMGFSQHHKAGRRFPLLFGRIINEYIGKAIVLVTGEPRYLDLTLETFQRRDFWDPILEKHPDCYRYLSPKLQDDLLGAT